MSSSTDADELARAAAAGYRAGDVVGAEELCRRALALAPEHRSALELLGLLLYFEERYTEAEEIFGQLAAREPDTASHWINIGTVRRSRRQFDQALRAYMRAAQLGADSADFYLNVGLTHLDRSDFESAREVLGRAAQLAPQYPDIRYQYARACYECRETAAALQALEGWEDLPDITPELAASAGELLMSLGEAERAERALGLAALDPAQEPRTSLTLTRALERSNRVAEARSLLDSLEQDPRAGALGSDVKLMRAQLALRESQYELAAELLQQLLDGREPHERHAILFPLAKALDGLERHDEAFEALVEAHRSQLDFIALSEPGAALRGPLTMTITQYGCDPQDVASWDDSQAPVAEASPIFVVGFPRSGTTLLELTLDAHPMLASMDEQPFLQDALDELQATGKVYPSELGRVSAAELDAVRRGYWERVQTRVRLAPGQRLVDKNPLNILRLPALRRLFPRSPILLVIRHPCDVILSCYMQHFRAPDFALLCSSLEQLAAGYRRTFDFWYTQQQLLAPRVHELRYERFVERFETEVHALAQFLDLPWDHAMLTPADHALGKGFISTPSYSQVVQPISSRSVGRWRRYRRHFDAALDELRPYLERWGYED